MKRIFTTLLLGLFTASLASGAMIGQTPKSIVPPAFESNFDGHSDSNNVSEMKKKKKKKKPKKKKKSRAS